MGCTAFAVTCLVAHVPQDWVDGHWVKVATSPVDIFECTHDVAEGAGAAAGVAVRKEAAVVSGKKVAAVLCGGNVDRDVFARVLSEG